MSMHIKGNSILICRNGVSPIFDASDNGIVKTLIDAGAKVNVAIPLSKYTPLHLAAKNGYSDIVSSLIRAGASIEAKDRYCLVK